MTIKGNLQSEQLLEDGTIIIDKDTPIKGILKIQQLLTEVLGEDNYRLKTIDKDRYHVFTDQKGNETILLCAATTYMGGNGKKTLHPTYLNRIQLKEKWKKINRKFESQYEIKFIGIYKFRDVIIFTDVIKDTYIKKKMNNSSAHIYMNDLYQAQKNGIFTRIDQNGNKLVSIDKYHFKKYLSHEVKVDYKKFQVFRDFNKEFLNSEWIIAIEAISNMKQNEYTHWKQGEWPGWNLEYRFQDFIESNKFDEIKYPTADNKNTFVHDFDLWMVNESHFADLKSSDESKDQVPGNDFPSVVDTIEKNGKLWYVVYEHNTVKDEIHDFEQTKKRNNFIKNEGELGKKIYDEMSYHTRMKHSVKYTKMFILELSKHNYHHYIQIFNQGKQPDGSARQPKIKFTKSSCQIKYLDNI